MTEAEWRLSTDPSAMLAHLRTLDHGPGLPTDRKLRLFACACCRTVWNRLLPSSKFAIEQAERFVDGGTTREAFYNARETCVGAVPFNYVWNCLAPDARSGAANAVARSADLTFPDAIGNESAVQASLLRDIFGKPWKPADFGWNVVRAAAFMSSQALNSRASEEQVWHGDWQITQNVLQIAKAIYEDRAFERMPILADALIDAGCDNADVLQHCQGREPCLCCEGTGLLQFPHVNQGAGASEPCRYCDSGWQLLRGPHVRGCWVLDTLLGYD